MLAREGQRKLLVGVVAVRSRDEVLAPDAEHRVAQPLRAKEPAPRERSDFRLVLAPQVRRALRRSARRRMIHPLIGLCLLPCSLLAVRAGEQGARLAGRDGRRPGALRRPSLPAISARESRAFSP